MGQHLTHRHHHGACGPAGVAGVLASLGLLAISAGIDVLFNDLDQLIEDGFKFLGICAWRRLGRS
ncbi:MAG: hypothetical protein GY926_20970 [bacterium]|nr:hypothetical protein [bacterium]